LGRSQKQNMFVRPEFKNKSLQVFEKIFQTKLTGRSTSISKDILYVIYTILITWNIINNIHIYFYLGRLKVELIFAKNIVFNKLMLTYHKMME